MDPILILLLLELLKKRGSSPFGPEPPEPEPPHVNPPFTVAPAPPGTAAPGPFQVRERAPTPGPMPGSFPSMNPPLAFPVGAASFGVQPVEETIEAGSQDQVPPQGPFQTIRRRKRRGRFGSGFFSAVGPLGDGQGASGQGQTQIPPQGGGL